ncbi:hypothetical protein BJ973_009737 [Actinoplanes tereljensis]|uniref:Uncharacterized protein n=1 Tax=Paractinoplanes tereljensis TaxID=571912 RepID=A0A919TPK5_9ACTN|nr:hypothetical protein [Actinoplanes tereljensis]GIF17301.1 hypothetical protein Ate02nite_00310 [Actinoplanes tereljensis]
MITIQRVRVRWGAASRGASHANARRGLCRPSALPTSLAVGEVVVHDVLADEAVHYVPHDDLLTGGLERGRDVDLWLAMAGAGLVVDRMPGWAAYPRQSGPSRLFTLMPGQIGRYRANFRFTTTTCACNPSWYYEDWLLHISNGVIAPDGFQQRDPDHEVDHRVHLYGGSRRVTGSRRQ